MRQVTLIVLISLIVLAAGAGGLACWTQDHIDAATYKPIVAVMFSAPILIAVLALGTTTRNKSLIPAASVGIVGLLTGWGILMSILLVPDSWTRSMDGHGQRWIASGLALLIVFIPALAAMMLGAIKPLRVAGITMAALCLVAGFCFLMGIWGDEKGGYWAMANYFATGRWARTAWMVLYVGAIGSFSLAGASLRQSRVLDWIILMVGALATILTVFTGSLQIWEQTPVDPSRFLGRYIPAAEPPSDTWRYFVRLLMVTVFCGHVNLMLRFRYRSVLVLSNFLAIVIGFLFCTLTVLYTVFESPEVDREMFQSLKQWMSFSGYLAAFITLAATGLWLLLRRGAPKAPRPLPFFTMERTCPNCGDRALSPLGASACDKCGLVFKLVVEEPRCPQCGYLLYMNRSDHCPECGASTPGNTLARAIASAPPLVVHPLPSSEVPPAPPPDVPPEPPAVL